MFLVIQLLRQDGSIYIMDLFKQTISFVINQETVSIDYNVEFCPN